MNCVQCGSLLEQDAKFCTNCGTQVNQEPAATVETANLNEGSSAATKSFQDNNFVQSVKEISMDYFHSIPNAIMKPFATSQQVTEADKVNGLITLILFSLFMPLYSFITVKQIGSYFYEPSFMDIYVKPFLILIVSFAVFTAVTFGVSKLMKVELSYFSVLTKLATLMVLPTAILVAAVVFVLLTVHSLGMILLSLSLLFASVASIATIFSVKSEATSNDGGLDVFHGIVIINVAMGILLLIIGDSLVGSVLDQIGGGFLF